MAKGQTKSNKAWGWEWVATDYTWITENANKIEGGTVCAQTNVKIKHDLGTQSAPLELSILAAGSVEVSSNPFLTPAKDGIGIMAGGDLKLSGAPSGGDPRYTGLFYAGSQCAVTGSAHLVGQLQCLDNPNPAGSKPWVAENLISGAAQIEYDCIQAPVMLRGEIMRLGRRSFGSPVY